MLHLFQEMRMLNGRLTWCVTALVFMQGHAVQAAAPSTKLSSRQLPATHLQKKVPAPVKAKPESASAAQNQPAKRLTARPKIGILMRALDANLAESLNLPASTKGILVDLAIRGYSADSAGLKKGDVIQSVDGEAVDSSDDILRILARHKIGEVVEFKILRNGLSVCKQVGLGTSDVVEHIKRHQLWADNGDRDAETRLRNLMCFVNFVGTADGSNKKIDQFSTIYKLAYNKAQDKLSEATTAGLSSADLAQLSGVLGERLRSLNDKYVSEQKNVVTLLKERCRLLGTLVAEELNLTNYNVRVCVSQENDFWKKCGCEPPDTNEFVDITDLVIEMNQRFKRGN